MKAIKCISIKIKFYIEFFILNFDTKFFILNFDVKLVVFTCLAD